jgi:transposase
MRQASERIPESAEKTVRDIRRATRQHHSAEEKIRIVLEGLRGEVSIAELCRKEGINQNLYYRWSKEFLEAGKKRLAGDTAREATSSTSVRGSVLLLLRRHRSDEACEQTHRMTLTIVVVEFKNRSNRSLT